LRTFFPLCWNWINRLSANEQRCSPILWVLLSSLSGAAATTRLTAPPAPPACPAVTHTGARHSTAVCVCVCVWTCQRKTNLAQCLFVTWGERNSLTKRCVLVLVCERLRVTFIEGFCTEITGWNIFYELVLQHTSLIVLWLKVVQTDMPLCLVWTWIYALWIFFIEVFSKCNDRNFFMRNSKQWTNSNEPFLSTAVFIISFFIKKLY